MEVAAEVRVLTAAVGRAAGREMADTEIRSEVLNEISIERIHEVQILVGLIQADRADSVVAGAVLEIGRANRARMDLARGTPQAVASADIALGIAARRRDSLTRASLVKHPYEGRALIHDRPHGAAGTRLWPVVL